jgi:hypothetical protein
MKVGGCRMRRNKECGHVLAGQLTSVSPSLCMKRFLHLPSFVRFSTETGTKVGCCRMQ